MLNDIFHKSRTNLILGGKGSGKTNFATVLMKELVSEGYRIFTNIHFFDNDLIGKACNDGGLPKGVTYQRVPSEIRVITSLSDLLYGLLESGPKAVFIDEAGIVSPSGTSKDTKNMRHLAYIIRHFGCAFTLITQVAGSVSPDLREKLVDYRLTIKKSGRVRYLEIGKRSIETDDDGIDYIAFPVIETISHLPMSVLPYDGDFPSSLKFDIDIKKAMDAFNDLDNSLLVKDQGKMILDDLLGISGDDEPDEPKKPSLKDKIRRLDKETTEDGKKKYTRKEIARKLDCSGSYVTQVLNN